MGREVKRRYDASGRPEAARATRQAILDAAADTFTTRGEAIPARSRAYVTAMRAEPDAARKLEIYALAIREIHSRLAPQRNGVRRAVATLGLLVTQALMTWAG
jgi:hypothetical protein